MTANLHGHQDTVVLFGGGWNGGSTGLGRRDIGVHDGLKEWRLHLQTGPDQIQPSWTSAEAPPVSKPPDNTVTRWPANPNTPWAEVQLVEYDWRGHNDLPLDRVAHILAWFERVGSEVP